jgi:hypothetical protein
MPNTNKTRSTTLKEWKTPDFRNTPWTINLKEEEIVDAPGKDGNASMPEQVKRPNPWRKMKMMMITSSSDISGYHAHFHEGHGTVGEWQGRGMACVSKRGTAWMGNSMGTAWARRGMCELTLIDFLFNAHAWIG